MWLALKLALAAFDKRKLPKLPKNLSLFIDVINDRAREIPEEESERKKNEKNIRNQVQCGTHVELFMFISSVGWLQLFGQSRSRVSFFAHHLVCITLSSPSSEPKSPPRDCKSMNAI